MTRETITYIPRYFNSINRGPLKSVDHKEERLIAHLMTVVEPITKESNISFYPYVYLHRQTWIIEIIQVWISHHGNLIHNIGHIPVFLGS